MTDLSPSRENSPSIRSAIYHALLPRSSNGKVPHDSLTAVAQTFNISPKTVKNYLPLAQDADKPEDVLKYLQSRKKINVDKKPTDPDRWRCFTKCLRMLWITLFFHCLHTCNAQWPSTVVITTNNCTYTKLLEGRTKRILSDIFATMKIS